MSDKLPIRLAAGSGPTFGVDDLACAAATHLGLWADEGLDVAWTPVHGGVAAINAVLDGTVDVSYGGLGPVIKSRAEGNPVRAVVSMARGLAQNLIVQKRIGSTDDLKGVSWALDGMNALSHHMARLTVRALGIDEADIDWQVVGPPPQRIDRLLSDTIDVSLIRVEEAISLSLEHADKVHNLLGFADLKKLVPTQPHGVLGTTEAYEAAHPEELARLTRGMIRASRALHDDYEIFRKVYDAHVSVPVPDDMIRTIWQQEHDSGGFAVNGEMSDGHWQEQMRLYRELYPELPQVSLDDILPRVFVADALEALGRHGGGFDKS
ncbi:MAG: ABC transporter substrate-binding protein [Alphaproteobacteria bacterium]|jgi:ABC-type nitrate/sulfonate/bicarbonate transport system substrate-binding protein